MVIPVIGNLYFIGSEWIYVVMSVTVNVAFLEYCQWPHIQYPGLVVLSIGLGQEYLFSDMPLSLRYIVLSFKFMPDS